MLLSSKAYTEAMRAILLQTAIVFLLSLEIAGLILLFGAQVIAEYERFTPESRPEAGGIQN